METNVLVLPLRGFLLSALRIGFGIGFVQGLFDDRCGLGLERGVEGALPAPSPAAGLADSAWSWTVPQASPLPGAWDSWEALEVALSFFGSAIFYLPSSSSSTTS